MSNIDAGDSKACESAAVALLARREHSRLEMERKLGTRDFDVELIAATLDRLEANGLLSETRFVERFVESRAMRGSGPVRIRAELVQRGIAPQVASEAIATSDQDWFAVALRVRVKRFGHDAPGDFKERARQARFLQYRGFEAAQVDAALEDSTEPDSAADPAWS